MSEESKPQELENDRPVVPKELTEQELNDIAGGGGDGSGAHPPGGPPPPAP